jgi:hypothetical protein
VVSATVARGVRSRALRAQPFSDRLYSAPVRYDDHLQRNWFYRSWSPLEPLPSPNSRAGILILLVKAAAPARRAAIPGDVGGTRARVRTGIRQARPARRRALLSGSPVFNSQPWQLVALAARDALPAIYERDYVAAGGLVEIENRARSFLRDVNREIFATVGQSFHSATLHI